MTDMNDAHACIAVALDAAKIKKVIRRLMRTRREVPHASDDQAELVLTRTRKLYMSAHLIKAHVRSLLAIDASQYPPSQSRSATSTPSPSHPLFAPTASQTASQSSQPAARTPRSDLVLGHMQGRREIEDFLVKSEHMMQDLVRDIFARWPSVALPQFDDDATAASSPLSATATTTTTTTTSGFSPLLAHASQPTSTPSTASWPAQGVPQDTHGPAELSSFVSTDSTNSTSWTAAEATASSISSSTLASRAPTVVASSSSTRSDVGSKRVSAPIAHMAYSSDAAQTVPTLADAGTPPQQSQSQPPSVHVAPRPPSPSARDNRPGLLSAIKPRPGKLYKKLFGF
ncbi:hypothetical protein BC831DRAFT_113450 [Entophlyctis helioformis]|nr:hypothetical protein BC831DRAFT_113450 [Entophlyctis helioformis]